MIANKVCPLIGYQSSPMDCFIHTRETLRQKGTNEVHIERRDCKNMDNVKKRKWMENVNRNVSIELQARIANYCQIAKKNIENPKYI